MDGGGAGIRRCSADAASTDERLRAEAIGSTAEGDASTAEPEVKSVAAVVTRHISFWQRCLPLLCLGLTGESYKHEPQHSHTLAQHHGWQSTPINFDKRCQQRRVHGLFYSIEQYMYEHRFAIKVRTDVLPSQPTSHIKV